MCGGGLMTNPHKNMKLKKLWFKQGEFEKMVSCLEGNYPEALFMLMYRIYKRGDMGDV